MAESFGSVVSSNMKWQVALALGLPMVVGVGYWYLIRKGTKSGFSKDDDSESNASRGTSTGSDTSSKTNQKRQEKTPLEEATLLKEEGNKCFKAGKFDEAITYYEKAIELCPKNEVVSLAMFYQNKAAACEQLKNYEEVKKACNEALLLNPKYTKALLRRAKAHEYAKELSEAFEDLTAACILENFQSQSSLLAADKLLRELGRQKAKEAMTNRLPIIPSNFFIGTFFMSYTNDPVHQFNVTEGDTSRGFLKAVELMKRKQYDSDYEDIMAACTEEINMAEGESSYRDLALLLRGTFHHIMGECSLAMADLDRVIDSEKADAKLKVNALIKRASVHIQKENQPQCLKDFERAIEIDPNNADIYHHRGQINLLLEKIQEAAEDFQTAASLNPDFVVTAVHKCYTDYRCALILRDENKLRSVMQTFEKIIAEHPQCGECYSLYAQALSDQQDFERADALFQTASKLAPENAALLVQRAVIKLQWSADIEAATNLINKALEIDDKCAIGYETLGTIEVQRGDLKRAIEMFDKAINLAKTELEISHLYGLKNAAMAQKTVLEKMNIQLPRDLIHL